MKQEDEIDKEGEGVVRAWEEEGKEHVEGDERQEKPSRGAGG